MAEVIDIMPGYVVWVPWRTIRFDGYIMDVLEKASYEPGEYITSFSRDKLPEELMW